MTKHSMQSLLDAKYKHHKSFGVSTLARNSVSSTRVDIKLIKLPSNEKILPMLNQIIRCKFGGVKIKQHIMVMQIRKKDNFFIPQRVRKQIQVIM